MLLRATRLCRMSPQMATLSPSIRLNRSRRVRMSSRPWVGCSCLPSPALMTLERMRWPRNCAAPDAPWRITTMSIRIASRFRAVSTSVSPLETDEPAVGHVHRVGAQPLLGELERDARAGGGLEEQVDDGLAAERRHLLDRPLAHFLERLGRVEDEPDLVGAQRLEARRGPCRGSGRSSQPPHQLDRVAAVELVDEHVHPVLRRRCSPRCPRCRPGSAAPARRGRSARRAGSAAAARSRRTRRARPARCGRCRARRPR